MPEEGVHAQRKRILDGWKRGLDQYPDKVALMDDDAWYCSLVGLTMRFYTRGLISEAQANEELDNKKDPQTY
jgi:hypothetical protein